MSRPSTVLRLSALCSILFVCVHSLHAEKLSPFDIVATTLDGTVFKIDPDTGAQQIISTGGLHPSPALVNVHADGTIIIANDNQDFPDYTQNLILIDPETELQTFLTTVSGLYNFDLNQSGLYLASGNRVEHIPAGQSTPQLISIDGLLYDTPAITIDHHNNIYVSDTSQSEQNLGYTLHVNPNNGDQTVLTVGGLTHFPFDLALSPDHSSIITLSENKIFKVNPTTGDQQYITSLNYFNSGIALDFINLSVDPRGRVLTIPTSFPGFITPNPLISIDIETGAQEILSQSGLLTGTIIDFEVFVPFPADADIDGIVDLRDLAILATFFGQTQHQTWSSGDFTHDGIVDLRDLAVLATYFGQSSSSLYPQTAPASSQTSTIPEPSTLAITLLAGTALLRRKHKTKPENSIIAFSPSRSQP